MKKFILPALIVGSLTLFSFTKPVQCGVEKIGENNFNVYGQVDFSPEDAAFIQQTLQKAYDISDLDLKSSKDGNFTLQGKAGKSFVNWHLFELLIIRQVYEWDNVKISEADQASINKMSAILEKYGK